MPGTPKPPSTCRIHELPLPKGADTATVSTASPDGRTLVGYADVTDSLRTVGVLWRDGKIAATIPDIPGYVVDMNSRGDLTGMAGDPSGPYPWVYSKGAVRKLTGGSVNAIGADGTLVGSRLRPTPNGPPVSVPARWDPGSDKPVDLPMPSFETGEAADITDDGTIIGAVGIDPFLWRPDGSSARLKRPGGAPAQERVEPLQASGSWAVGNDGHGGAARWRLGKGAPDVVPEAVPGVRYDGGVGGHGPLAINADGVVVVQDGYDAKVAGGGQVVTLPTLSSSNMNSPVSISADATVIGGSTVLNMNPGSGSFNQPIYWTCKP